MNQNEQSPTSQSLFSRSQARSQQEYIEWLQVQLQSLLKQENFDAAKALLVLAHPANMPMPTTCEKFGLITPLSN